MATYDCKEGEHRVPIDIECPFCRDPIAIDDPIATDADGMPMYPCATSNLGPGGCVPTSLRFGHLFHRHGIEEWS